MGLPLLIIGLLMVIVGGRGTYAQFGSQVASEFQGQGSFTYWLIAIAAVGAIGYFPAIQKISRYLMALIIISIFLSHKGFFAKFQAALAQGPIAPNALPSSGSNVTAAQSGAISPSQALSNQTTSAFGTPTDPNSAQGKFNGWMNYLFGANQASPAAP
jgi:hypothetical protein